MKYIKSTLVASLVAISFFTLPVQAQIRSENSPRVNLMKDLILRILPNDKSYQNSKSTIEHILKDNSSLNFAPNCPRFAPILYYMLNNKAILTSDYTLQGISEYDYAVFEKGKQVLYKFSFNESYDSYQSATIDGITPEITIIQNNSVEELSENQAKQFIINNICRPLNQALDQNSNMPEAQLINTLRQRFSK